ncbi:hypothetical protein ACVBEH_07510 [Roseateles sp. GG27B]
MSEQQSGQACGYHRQMLSLKTSQAAIATVFSAVFAVLAVTAFAVGCAAASSLNAPLLFSQPLILLGEVHDNAAQHALRLRV